MIMGGAARRMSSRLQREEKEHVVEQPDFLKLPDGPDFDASKAFKPPPVSHADMMSAVPGAGSRRPPPASKRPVLRIPSSWTHFGRIRAGS